MGEVDGRQHPKPEDLDLPPLTNGRADYEKWERQMSEDYFQDYEDDDSPTQTTSYDAKREKRARRRRKEQLGDWDNTEETTDRERWEPPEPVDVPIPSRETGIPVLDMGSAFAMPT